MGVGINILTKKTTLGDNDENQKEYINLPIWKVCVKKANLQYKIMSIIRKLIVGFQKQPVKDHLIGSEVTKL